MKPAFFAFDVETSGLYADQHEILSIAMILLDDGFNELARKVIYAFPEKPVDAKAAEVNGYTAELWTERGAVSQIVLFAEVYEFVKNFRKLIPMGHNVPFDVSFLKALFANNGSDEYRQIFSYHLLDTVSVSLLFDMVLFGKKHQSQKLEALCERFGIKLDNAHDALADISATVALFKYYYTHLGGAEKRAEVPPAIQFSRMLKKEDGKWFVGGGKHKGRPLDEVARTDPNYLDWMLNKVDDLSDLQKQVLQEAIQRELVGAVTEPDVSRDLKEGNALLGIGDHNP